jgi:PAS domain S-box-containing protein
MPSETILVVEDNPSTRNMFRFALEAAGYAVLEAADGRTALDLAAQHAPAMVLLDLLLPDMNGIDLCRQLRSSLRGVEMPIIAVSGLQSRLDEARSFQAGFTDYLFKPVAPSRLLDVIHTHLPAKVDEKKKAGRDRRVLLVDDDPVQRKLNTLQLEGHGFQVIPVQGGAEALSHARETPPDAIVADVLMPGMNGMELCLAIRTDPQLSRVPVILTSSTLQYLEDADRAMGHELGASDLVLRTPGLKEVIASLIACLAEAPPPPQPSSDARAVASKHVDRLLRQVGLQASLNSNLAQRAALDAALLSITSSAAAVLTRQLSLQQMLDEMLDCVLEAGGISAGAIYLLKPEGGVTLPSQIGCGQPECLEFFGHLSFLREIIDAGRLVHIPHESVPEDVAAHLLKNANATSLVIAPLISAGEPLGALVMLTSRRELEERWLASIGAVASQLAQAVTLSRALETMSGRARTAELNAQIGRALTGSTSLHDMLRRCAESFVEYLDAAIVRIWTFNRSDNVLELRASAGLDADTDIDSQQRVPVGQSRIGLIAGERRSEVTNDLAAGPPMDDHDWTRRVGVVAFAGYPLVVEDELVGVIAAFAGKPFSALTQRTLASVAAGIGVGVKRRRAEEELLATQARLERVLASSGAVIYLLQTDHGDFTPVWISDNVQRVMGFETAEAMAPAWWQQHIHPEDRDRVLGQYAILLERGQLALEYRFRHKDGAYHWILDEHRLLAAAPGRPAEVIGSWVDITERKRLEEQFLQSQKMEAIGRLAGGVAHDFNNVLTAILGYAELGLLELGEQDPLREHLTEIQKGADRAAGLTHQLLAFSRRQVLAPRVFDLNEIVADIQKMLLRLVGEDVDLATELSSEPGRVKADPGQLQQVIANLVINARDAMPTGGKLTLETSTIELGDTQTRASVQIPAGRYVVLAVTDTGTGMDETTRARVFEPFFTTKEQGKGTGLGLSTVYGFVTQSNGFIWVYSEPGHGTTFRIYLPRVEEPAVALVSAPLPAQIPVGRESVLVAEDDDAVRTLVRVALSKRGYRVLVAANGGEALLLCERHPGVIDLLLTDLVMPGMGGLELFERLVLLRPQMRALFVSGYADRAVLRHGEIVEGMAFLEKPFTPDSLARKVREVLDVAPGVTRTAVGGGIDA